MSGWTHEVEPVDDGVMPRLEPQPRNGQPFRISFSNRGDEYWYNERLAHGRGPMLISWKCPFGVNGEPVFVGGEWRWRRVERGAKMPKPPAIRQQTRGDSMAYAWDNVEDPEALIRERGDPNHTPGDLLYIACPYTCLDAKCEEGSEVWFDTQGERGCQASRAAHYLIASCGMHVFSPLSHSCAIEVYGHITHDEWMRQDRWYLERASELVVLCIDGWEQSKGVQEERRIARERGIPESFLFVEGESYRWERSNAHTA